MAGTGAPVLPVLMKRKGLPMDATAWAWAFAGIGWSGLLAFVGMCVTGQLVPGSYKERAERWQAAAETLQQNDKEQKELLKEAAFATKVATAAAEAITKVMKDGAA